MDIKSKEIEIVKIEELKPNPKNRNKHSEEQVARLAEIIKYQGFRTPVIVSNQTGQIVAGHGRLLAAKKLGLKQIPVTYQDFESPEQEYAAQVSDNAISSWAELDFSGINADIGDLGPDFDINLLAIKGFTMDAFERVRTVNSGDESSEWVGLPDFEPGQKEIKLTCIFSTELERELFVQKHKLPVDAKHSGQWTSRI